MPPRKGHTRAKDSQLGGEPFCSADPDPGWRCDTRANLISAKFKTLGKRMLGRLWGGNLLSFPFCKWGYTSTAAIIKVLRAHRILNVYSFLLKGQLR